jgi:hypothetical protein
MILINTSAALSQAAQPARALGGNGVVHRMMPPIELAERLTLLPDGDPRSRRRTQP